VAEIERAEVERMSPAQKFADLCMLVDVRRGLGGSAEADDGVALVRKRWGLLVERLGV